MSIRNKRIRIPYSGPIYAKAGVYGPITNPYREDIPVIQQILMAGIPVVEVVNGREIDLNLSNFKQDFTVPDPEVTVPVPSDFTEEVEKDEAVVAEEEVVETVEDAKDEIKKDEAPQNKKHDDKNKVKDKK